MKTTTPLNDALNPCPFCQDGGNPILVSHPSETFDMEHYVWCNRCDTTCTTSAYPDQAIAAWNTRADTPESSAAQGAMTDPNIERNVDLLRSRSAVGIKKYGVTTDKSGLTHEQWLKHLLEELLDGANYIQAALAQPSDATAQQSDEVERLTLELQNANELVKHWRSLANTAQGKPEQSDKVDADRWRAMRELLVAVDFAPEMGGGPVAMFECHAERVTNGPKGADIIADAALAAKKG